MSDPNAKPALAALTPMSTAIALAMASQLVAGFATGSSFRVPVLHGHSLRFMRDPVVGLVMAGLAMGFTFLIARAAFAASRPRVGAALCVVAGTVAGGLNGFLALTLLSVVRADLELGPVVASSQKSIASGFAMLPPGFCWSFGTAAIVAVTPRGGADRAPAVAHAAWAGGLALVASSEAGLVLFGDTPLTVIVTLAGLLFGLACIAHGIRADRRRVLPSLGVLVAAQAWIGMLHLYWRR